MATKVRNAEWMLHLGGETPRKDQKETQKTKEQKKRIQKAFKVLNNEEAGVLRDKYYSGLSVKQIAEGNGIPVRRVKQIETTALHKLKQTLDGKSEYPECPICQHDDYVNLNLFIHLWFDSHNGSIRGLIKEIRKYWEKDLCDKLTLNTAKLKTHVSRHLGLKEPPPISNRKTKAKPKTSVVTKEKITMSIPLDLKEKIERLATENNLPQAYIFREALAIGTSTLEGMMKTRQTLEKIIKEMGSQLFKQYLEKRSE